MLRRITTLWPGVRGTCRSTVSVGVCCVGWEMVQSEWCGGCGVDSAGRVELGDVEYVCHDYSEFFVARLYYFLAIWLAVSTAYITGQ